MIWGLLKNRFFLQSLLATISFLSLVDTKSICDSFLYKHSVSLIESSTVSTHELEVWESWAKKHPMIYYATLDKGLASKKHALFFENSLQDLRIHFDTLADENEKIVAFYLIDKWKAFDTAFEAWLIEKGQLLFPEEPSFKARAYIYQWPEEFEEDFSHEKKRKVLDFIESMLRF